MTLGGLTLAPKNSALRCSTEASPLPLEISTLVVADTAVARLRGDLDHATAPQLQTWAAKVLGVGARNLVIDCTEITFLDCGALRVLIELARAIHQRSGYLTVRHCTPAVRRIFEITGLVDSLGVEPLSPFEASVTRPSHGSENPMPSNEDSPTIPSDPSPQSSTAGGPVLHRALRLIERDPDIG